MSEGAFWRSESDVSRGWYEMERNHQDPRAPRSAPQSDALSRDVVRELNQIAHFGKAGLVKAAVAAATEAYEQGLLDEAAAHLEEAKRHAPRSPSIRELAGLIHYDRGKWREAARELAAYRRLSGRSDQDPVYADALRALGRPGKAVEVLQELSPEDVTEEVFVEGLIVQSGALVDEGRAAEAVAVLRRGPLEPAAVQAHHLRLWYALAEALEAGGRWDDAREWWDAIYAEDADFFDVATRRLGGGRP